MANKSRSDYLRKVKAEYWATVDAFTGGDHDKGWFRAPRTLPLILSLLQDKALTGNRDPTRVYLELFSRHYNTGVVEIQSESEHAYAAGYRSSRATRTWQEHMRCLEQLGFIKIQAIGSHAFKYVLLVHPAVAIEQLRSQGKVQEDWWVTYTDRRNRSGELSVEERMKTKTA